MAYRELWIGEGLVSETGDRVYMTEDGFYVDTGTAAVAGTGIFTPAVALGTNDTNANSNFRVFTKLSGASNGQLRVTFRASTALPLTILGAAVGKWDGITLSSAAADMTTAPHRLLFNGNAAVTIPAGGLTTSDFVTHSNFSLATNDWVIVTFYVGATGTGQRYSNGAGNTNVTTAFKAVGTDYSQAQTAAAMGNSLTIVGNVQPGGASGYDFSVDLVETNVSGGGGGGGKPVKVWNGSSWVTKTLKVWNGSAWVTKPVKIWNGSAWV